MSRLHPSFFEAPIAHRGLHDQSKGIVENSLGAVEAAMAAGYGIEIDLQPASDSTPVVFHDYVLDRLTERKGPVRTLSLQELGSIVLSGSHDAIPTLQAVLEMVGGRVPLLVEIKDQDLRLGANVGDFAEHVCDVVTGYEGPIALMSFSPDTMIQVKSYAPEIPAGLVTDPFEAEDWPNVPQARRQELRDMKKQIEIGLDFISHKQSDLQSDAVRQAKQAGLPVFCWTIRSDEDAQRALKIADNITFEGYLPPRRLG